VIAIIVLESCFTQEGDAVAGRVAPMCVGGVELLVEATPAAGYEQTSKLEQAQDAVASAFDRAQSAIAARHDRAPMLALSSEQVRHVHELVRDRPLAVGLAEDRADLVADASVGILMAGGWQ
jgi:hypothetical protein